MAENLGIGVSGLERLQHFQKCGFLFGRAGVCLATVGQQPSLVADANRMLVVVPGMRTDDVLVQGLIHLPVPGDVVVISAPSETLVMVGDEPSHGVWPVLPRRRAVNNNEINSSHNISH